MSTRRATRDDVARLAKTSTAVVSYVINNGPRQVSEERRRRVLAAMAALDYYPNAHARSLAATETRTIGMIVPNISNAYFSELALAVEDEAVADGRLLFLGNSSEDSEREIAYLQSFIQQRVDGILIVGVTQTSTIDTARRAGIPVVIVDRELGEPDVTTVSIDHRTSSRIATQHLLDHGHSTIACVIGPEHLSVAEQRLEGWADAIAAAGAASGPVVRTAFSIDGGREAFAQLGADGSLPTAVFVATDDQARGMIAAAHDAGVAVPEELAIVSIDGTREGAQGSPSLTAVRQPYRRLAQVALGALRDGDTGGSARHVYVDSELVVGRSCGCRPDQN
jgi:LacI family transcriptional regulator